MKIKGTLILGLIFSHTIIFSQTNWQKGGNSNIPVNSQPIIGTDASWNSPLFFHTFGQNRMALWGNTGSPSTPFGGGLSINLNPANPINVPKSLLTIGEDADGIGEANSGWRAWMRVGTFNQGGSDLAYFGLKNEGTGDRNDAVIAWGDDRGLINSPNQFAPDYFRFIFSSDYGSNTDLPNDPQGTNSLEIARLSPFGRMGIGNFYNHPLFPITREPARRLEILSDKTVANGNGSPLIRLTHTQQNPNVPNTTGKFSEFEPRSNGNLFISVRDNTLINNATHNLKERFVGINTNNAGNTLEINSQLVNASTLNGFAGINSTNATGWSGLRFTDLNSSSVPQANGNGVDNTKILSVNQNGDVVLVDGNKGNNGIYVSNGTAQLGGSCSSGAEITASRLTTNRAIYLNSNTFWFEDGNAGTGGFGIGGVPSGSNSFCNVANTVEISANNKGKYGNTDASGLRLSKLTSASPILSNGTNGVDNTKVLTVDEDGDVVLVEGGGCKTTLVKTSTFTGNANGCPNGGTIIEYGIDTNCDGVLQASETNTALTQYVCNGSNGAQGIPGPAGGVVNANNGLSIVSSSLAVLGQGIGAPGNPAILTQNREIPMDDRKIYFTGADNHGSISVGVPGNGSVNGSLQANTYDYYKKNGINSNFYTLSGSTIGTLAGRFHNVCTANSDVNIAGIESYAIRNTSSSTARSTGVLGIALGDGHSNYGGYFQGTGASTRNIGVYASANGSTSPNTPNPAQINLAGYFNGDVYITGSFGPSDNKLKQNITEIDNATSIIKQLRPTTFDYKHADFPSMVLPQGLQYGLIAQEVEQVLPALVTNNIQPAVIDSTGNVVIPEISFKGLEYQQLIPILIQAIKEQQSKIDSLTTQLNSKDSIQDTRLAALEEAINRCCSNNTARNNNSTVLNQLDVELSDKDAVVLNQNVPNPFAEQTTITYNVPTSVSKAQLLFYNTEGKLIQTVDITTRGKGKINVFANDLSSGLYHYTLVVDGKVADSKKMVRE